MYTVGDGGNPPIYTMRANGTRVTPIGSGLNPRWSPNGSKIAFHTTLLPGLLARGASWSPDATRLVLFYVAPGLMYENIYTSKLDGTDMKHLTFDTQMGSSRSSRA